MISLKINTLKLYHFSHNLQELKHSVVAVVLADNKVKTIVVLDPFLLVARSRIAIDEVIYLPI